MDINAKRGQLKFACLEIVKGSKRLDGLRCENYIYDLIQFVFNVADSDLLFIIYTTTTKLNIWLQIWWRCAVLCWGLRYFSLKTYIAPKVLDEFCEFDQNIIKSVLSLLHIYGNVFKWVVWMSTADQKSDFYLVFVYFLVWFKRQRLLIPGNEIHSKLNHKQTINKQLSDRSFVSSS